jgi:hypothetical protein
MAVITKHLCSFLPAAGPTVNLHGSQSRRFLEVRLMGLFNSRIADLMMAY